MKGDRGFSRSRHFFPSVSLSFEWSPGSALGSRLLMVSSQLFSRAWILPRAMHGQSRLRKWWSVRESPGGRGQTSWKVFPVILVNFGELGDFSLFVKVDDECSFVSQLRMVMLVGRNASEQIQSFHSPFSIR